MRSLRLIVNLLVERRASAAVGRLTLTPTLGSWTAGFLLSLALLAQLHGATIAQAAAAGSPADDDKSITTLRDLGRHGDVNAMLSVAQRLESVPDARIEAYAWFALAAKRANTPEEDRRALLGLGELRTVLMPRDEIEARATADNWDRQIPPASDRLVQGTSLSASDFVIGRPLANKAADDVDIGAAEEQPVIRRIDEERIMLAQDQTWTEEIHRELTARTDAGVRQIGAFSIFYDAVHDDLGKIEAYTLKKDGRRISADVSKAIDQVAGTDVFSDDHIKTIEFPDVAMGDAVSIRFSRHHKPLIPGLLAAGFYLDLRTPVVEGRLEVILPSGLHLFTETQAMSLTRSESAGQQHYVWEYSYPGAGKAPPKWQVDYRDFLPHANFSNFPNYESLARAILPIVSGASHATPEIQAKADELTQGIADPRKQAEAIYNWVSRNIRYVAIELGSSRLVPHDASSVLKNGYGDCKDHSVLFSALLEAKGISSELVLIGVKGGQSLPVPATPWLFDHMITYIPTLNLYADTTATVAPFGVLPASEIGKPVLHITPEGSAVRRIPVADAAAASLITEVTGKVTESGAIIADTKSDSTGIFSIVNRARAFGILQNGATEGAREYLKSRNWEGTGRLAPVAPLDLAPNFLAEAHFEIDARPEIMEGQGFYPGASLALGATPGYDVIGDLTVKDTGLPIPCHNAVQDEEITLELPPGYHVAQLPKPLSYESPHATFTASWALSGHAVKVHRTFRSQFADAICIGAVREEIETLRPVIRSEYRHQLVLIKE